MIKLLVFLAICLSNLNLSYSNPNKNKPQYGKPKDQGFKFSLGALSFIRENIFENGRGNEVRVFPSLSMQYKKFSLRGNQLGYSIIKNKSFSLASSLSFEFNGGQKPEPGSVMFGMVRRKNTLWANIIIAKNFLRYYEVKTSFSHDILGEINAWKYSLTLKRKLRFGRTFFAGAGFQASWLTKTFSSYYYGVRPEEANTSRAAYSPDSSITGGPFIDVLYLISRKWSFFGLAKLDCWQDEIANSPIVRRSSSPMVLLSLSYQF